MNLQINNIKVDCVILEMVYRMSVATINVLVNIFVIWLLGVTQALPQRCHRDLGMEDGKIKDSQITYSSVRQGMTASSEQARLHHNVPPWGAWCPDTSRVNFSAKNISYDQFVEIDLLNPTKISGVAIQGQEFNGRREFADSYKISYSTNGRGWINYAYREKEKPFDMILSGPKNPKSVVRSILDPIIEARHVRIHPGYMKGQNVCMRLELYGCAFEKDVKGVPVQDPTVSMYENYKSGCAGLTTNSIVMFFAGVATTLGTVLLVVFIFRIRRRNYEVSKLATGINAVHTAVETQTEHAIDAPAVVVLIEPVTKPPPQNIQNIEYAVPENSRTCPYEQVDDSPPVPSVYTGLDIIRRDGRETDDRNYQKLLKRESDYVIPANSVSDSPDEEGRGEFKSKTPLGYTELDLTKLGQTNNPPYQHLIRRPSKPLH